MSTGIDGETVDPARVLWMLGVMVFFGGSITLMIQGHWDMQSYGIGFGAVLSLGAAAVRIKQSSEPASSAPTKGEAVDKK